MQTATCRGLRCAIWRHTLVQFIGLAGLLRGSASLEMLLDEAM
jgi:hypothetical protein